MRRNQYDKLKSVKSVKSDVKKETFRGRSCFYIGLNGFNGCWMRCNQYDKLKSVKSVKSDVKNRNNRRHKRHRKIRVIRVIRY